MDIYCFKTKIDYITKKNLFDRIDSGERFSIIGCAAHNVVRAYNNNSLQTYIDYADFRIPDGVPLTWPHYFVNKKIVNRFNGMDLVEYYFFKKNNFNHFFIGASSEILSSAEQNILKINENFNLVGTYIPPFSKVSDWNIDEIMQEIKNSRANFIWVGVGSLKQEELMFKLKKLDNNLNMYSAGAAFDWVSGKTKRAPQIFKKIGMEWFYRLITEPNRLWKRYIIDNSLFILLFIRQAFTKESFKKPLI